MAAIRIWFQSAVEMDAASPIARPHRHTAGIVQLGTTVDVFGVSPGSWAGQQPSAPCGFPVAFAEMLVTLHRKAGLRTGRRWHTPMPSPERIDLFVSRLP